MGTRRRGKGEGTIETQVGTLPEPLRAGGRSPRAQLATNAVRLEEPTLTREQLRQRQEAFGTRRKETGPPLEGGAVARLRGAVQRAEDAPETDVREAEETSAQGINPVQHSE